MKEATLIKIGVGAMAVAGTALALGATGPIGCIAGFTLGLTPWFFVFRYRWTGHFGTLGKKRK